MPPAPRVVGSIVMLCGNKMEEARRYRECLHFTSMIFHLPKNMGKRGSAMAKPFAVCALCIISAAAGAGIDHYFGATIEQGAPHLQQAVTPKAAVAAPAGSNGDVLGDRVKCDIRYQELKVPPSEYQAFKRKCMGEKYSDND
jgi:hypothetical protein